MANFTQLHLGNKTPQETSSKAPSKNSLSRQKTLFGAGLLAVTVLSGVFLLITNGCSKGPAKVAAVNSAKQSAAQTSAGSGLTNPTPVLTPTVPTENPKPARKRAVQRKAPTATYSDPLHGISFRYPKNYILKTGDEPSFDLAGMGPVKTAFVQPGGMTVAAIEMPRTSYPGTDFSSAFFSVSVNPQLTASQCEQVGSPQVGRTDNEPGAASKVKVGGTEFNVVENLGGGEKKEPRMKYYHLFENATCYEFSMGLATADGKVDGLKPINHDQVFRKLDQILATVKVQPGVVPEVAKGAQDHPVVEGSKE
jgi:hypothetical protein